MNYTLAIFVSSLTEFLEYWYIYLGTLFAILLLILTILTQVELFISNPVVQKVILWVLEKVVPRELSKFFGKRILRRLRNQIRLKNPKILLDSGTAVPMLFFWFTLDSKASVKFQAEEATAYIYMDGGLIDKIRWNRHERILHSSGKADIADLDVPPFIDNIEDVPALGEAKVQFHYAPSLEVLKSEFASRWKIRGVVILSSKLGKITKPFYFEFDVDKHELERAKKKYLES